MQVTPSPLWESLLFERSWPAVLALGWLAVVMVMVAQRRQDKRLLYVGGGLALAAVGVGLLARMVVTDREVLIERTRELVAHTSPLDLDALEDDFTPGARLIGPNGDVWLERDAVLSALKRADERQRLHGQSIRHVDASTTGNGRGLSELRITTRIGQTGEFPIPTVWLLTWERGADDRWRVQDAQWLEIRGAPPGFGVWQ